MPKSAVLKAVSQSSGQGTCVPSALLSVGGESIQ